ncbi:hypothetical protein Daus18300_009284 [Diaporthe australafricana]|uniref:Myb-like domain-containing protein n=1 Tax=Diaporthe australafricana TaxID=127596 RepID=A0ABR3WES7_9PEZI
MASTDNLTRRAKRKRSTALLEPEEVTANIMHKLESCRAGLDKKLAEYNELVMQTQTERRQSFIKSFEERIENLPEDVRSSVAAQLLADEEFAAGMNFSEVGTSDNKSGALSWSAEGTSLSETSWRTILKRHVEGAPASSPPGMHMLGTATQATSKASFSHASSPTASNESMGHETSMSDPGMTKGEITDDDDEDEEDILSTSHVTISRPRTVKKSKRPASLKTTLPSPRARRAVAKQGKSPLSPGGAPRWSKEEFATLKKFCYGKNEAAIYLNEKSRGFWEDVSAQLDNRSPVACCQKWRKSTRGGRAPENRQFSSRPWSKKEMKILTEECSTRTTASPKPTFYSKGKLISTPFHLHSIQVFDMGIGKKIKEKLSSDYEKSEDVAQGTGDFSHHEGSFSGPSHNNEQRIGPAVVAEASKSYQRHRKQDSGVDVGHDSRFREHVDESSPDLHAGLADLAQIPQDEL